MGENVKMDLNGSLESDSAVIVDGKRYIVVKLGNEQYGIDIQYVDNIVRMQRITRVPKAQSYYNGVINLRGEVVPVMSIRNRFGLELDEFTHMTRIIIVKIENQGMVGVLVDEVKEIVTLDESNTERPNFKNKDELTNYLYGIGKHKDGLISLLDIVEVITEKKDE
jgi:purine-binding chemotaxis protein CheW